MPSKSKVLLLALLLGGGAILLSKKASAQPSTSAEQLACESSGKFWYNDSCHDVAPTACDCVSIVNVDSPKTAIGDNTGKINIQIKNGCSSPVDLLMDLYDFTDIQLFDKFGVENVPITVPPGINTFSLPSMTRLKNGVADLLFGIRNKDTLILCDSINFTNSSL